MPTNSRLRERLGHDQRRCAVAAADVGHLGAALELVDHAVERRQPLAQQVRLVAGPEEPLDAAEQAVAVLAPADALAGLEGLGQLRLVGEHGGQRIEAARHVDGAVLVGEHGGLLGRQRERAGRRVVGDEAGRRLRGQPLAHVALVRAGLGGELGRGELALRRARETARACRRSARAPRWRRRPSRSPSSRAGARACSCPDCMVIAMILSIFVSQRRRALLRRGLRSGAACA